MNKKTTTKEYGILELKKQLEILKKEKEILLKEYRIEFEQETISKIKKNHE